MTRNALFLGLALAAAPALGQIGPDVIVIDLFDTAHWGPVGDIHAYAVGTRSCNIGDMNALWQSWNSNHPVIAQNLYRLKDGRFEQIGLSWVKHGFAVIDSGYCPGTCTATGSVLGPGCADPYWATLNGDRSRMGPRYEVNAANGVFPYPFDNSAPIVDQTSRRIRVHDDDLNPSLNSGALYFVEGQYVLPDDSAWGNNQNNQSYRRTTVGSTADRPLTLQGPTYDQLPAVQAWQDHGNGVDSPDLDVQVLTADVPGDGRFWLAGKATPNRDRTWHYEYAIQNITSDRSGGSFTVPIPAGAAVANVGFHDVDYHSGEPWDPTDWNWTIGPSVIIWSSPQTYNENPASNALRWGTAYNYWFDVNAAPGTGTLKIGLFKPGAPTAIAVNMVAPSGPPIGIRSADIDGQRSAVPRRFP